MATLAGFYRIHFLTLVNDLSLSFLAAASKFSFANQVIAAVIWWGYISDLVSGCHYHNGQIPEITGMTLVPVSDPRHNSPKVACKRPL